MNIFKSTQLLTLVSICFFASAIIAYEREESGPEYWAHSTWDDANKQWIELRWYRVNSEPDRTEMTAINYSMVGANVGRPTAISNISRAKDAWSFRLTFPTAKTEAKFELTEPGKFDGNSDSKDDAGKTYTNRVKLVQIKKEQLSEATGNLIGRIDIELAATESQLRLVQKYIDDEEYQQKIDREQQREISAIRHVGLLQNIARRQALQAHKLRLQDIRLEAERAKAAFGR